MDCFHLNLLSKAKETLWEHNYGNTVSCQVYWVEFSISDAFESCDTMKKRGKKTLFTAKQVSQLRQN